ncbi:MAG TPA: lipoyl(octanoyl) transferase LipB [Candidatus Deferrimicrobium sp.]|nr:lipoyl(octanoyl) transferase LipB [Candidatus Deferrimicrobium sp.]
MAVADSRRYGWLLKLGRVDYERTLRWQHGLVKMRREGLARDTIILVEHPAVVTVGRDGHAENYDNLATTPLFVERGGDVTYHGPGQLVVYFIFDLARRGKDLHRFMAFVQQGIIEALREYRIEAGPGEEHTGVWTDGKKIASIGIAVKHWISFHGAAVNVNTRLRDFSEINPCGLDAALMTSVKQIRGRAVSLDRFGRRLVDRYNGIFKTDFQSVALEELAEEIESQAGGYAI